MYTRQDQQGERVTELGKDENGKRKQYTVTSMDRAVVDAKIAAKHAEMTA